ncbi:hypothetical protein B0H13DRAFT_1878258 [Mycena leptocephala]|nr:hypothetical protein B0H13DRAFT_1878258 [Mycena leptocephala]
MSEIIDAVILMFLRTSSMSDLKKIMIVSGSVLRDRYESTCYESIHERQCLPSQRSRSRPPPKKQPLHSPRTSGAEMRTLSRRMFPQPTFVVSLSLAGVRKVAADVNVYSDPIHLLIHNTAATIGSPSTRLSTRPNPETFNSPGAFFEVKVANVLTAVELSKRSKEALNAYSLHRGVTNAVLTSITKTRLFANEDVVASDPANAAELWTLTEKIRIGQELTF